MNRWIRLMLAPPGIAAAALLTLALAWPARAQEGDETFRQSVARVSFVDGTVSFSRGDDPDDWQAVGLNVPVTLGDHLFTDEGSRLELQVDAGNFLRLAPGSDLQVLNLTEDVAQFSLRAGIASFRLRRLEPEETYEIDTPNVAVTLDAPGLYRVEVNEQGDTRVSVRRGSATAAAAGGQVDVPPGQMLEVDGYDAPQYAFYELPPADGFDAWALQRDRLYQRSVAYRYVSVGVVGASDLDAYGRWVNLPSYGWVWTPRGVPGGWAPYREGHWVWQDPWGWTWVSYEPWGWAPYHYGRWAVVGGLWYWVPVPHTVRVAAYAPALVGFVGAGPGWGVSIGFSGGFVGWFPLAPGDPFFRWWGPRPVHSPERVRYVNRTYVTVVNQQTFVSGAAVAPALVRDRAIVRRVESAPIVRGPVPVVPTAASLRVASRPGLAAPRPPAAVVSRSVVTRIAPPPAPPTFRSKLAVISRDRGAPVSPSEAARLSIASRGGARAAVPVRPAASSSLNLRPARGGAAPAPKPVVAPRGRALATPERPLVAAPHEAAQPSAPAPARMAPGAVAPRSVEPRGQSWRQRGVSPPPPPPTKTPEPRRERFEPAPPAPPPAPRAERPRGAAPRGEPGSASPPPSARGRGESGPAASPAPRGESLRARPARAPEAAPGVPRRGAPPPKKKEEKKDSKEKKPEDKGHDRGRQN